MQQRYVVKRHDRQTPAKAWATVNLLTESVKTLAWATGAAHPCEAEYHQSGFDTAQQNHDGLSALQHDQLLQK
jgi:hypothetical protein